MRKERRTSVHWVKDDMDRHVKGHWKNLKSTENYNSHVQDGKLS